MGTTISKENIAKIKTLRAQGCSLPEIHRKLKVGYGTVSKYIKDVNILPQYKDIWQHKRKGSVARMLKNIKIANQKAQKNITGLTEKEKLLFISALYWAEGGKKDFNFTNSDPEMVRIFISGLVDILKIRKSDIRVSVRVYQDLDRELCLNFWSNITGISIHDFAGTDTLKGKKLGKLQFGICRIRIKKGGNMLKYLLAVSKQAGKFFKSPRSSTDRTRES